MHPHFSGAIVLTESTGDIWQHQPACSMANEDWTDRWAVRRWSLTKGPDGDSLMLEEKNRHTDADISPVISIKLTLSQGATLTLKFAAFTISYSRLYNLAAIRGGQKLSPLIASSTHGQFIYPCCITTQHWHAQISAKNHGLSLENRASCWQWSWFLPLSESQSFTQILTLTFSSSLKQLTDLHSGLGGG